MSTEELSKILDTIKKLFALGQSPNEAEASLAIAKAHQLLVKYNLDIADLKTDESNVIEEEFSKENRSAPWKQILLQHIVKVNFCGIYREVHFSRKTPAKSYSNFGPTQREAKNYITKIVGKKHNIVAAVAMAEYLFEAIDRLADGVKGTGRSFVASYKSGLADNLSIRLKAMIKRDKAEGSDSRELVVSAKADIDNFFKNLDLQHGKIKQNISDSEAYAHGRQDGDRIRLNQQLRGETRSSTLAIGQ
jgi:hypothetical protein